MDPVKSAAIKTGLKNLRNLIFEAEESVDYHHKVLAARLDAIVAEAKRLRKKAK